MANKWEVAWDSAMYVWDYCPALLDSVVMTLIFALTLFLNRRGLGMVVLPYVPVCLHDNTRSLACHLHLLAYYVHLCHHNTLTIINSVSQSASQSVSQSEQLTNTYTICFA